MRWHYLQHAHFEGPAYLATWAWTRGFPLTRTRVWKGDPLPSLDQFDGLFLLGGPMNVYEEEKYPWLASEKKFILETIAAGKTAVGVCLGAQLLSVVLGGSVTKNSRPEIGWFPVALTPAGRKTDLFRDFPERFMAFHWHGDRFSIPAGAIHVARTEVCEEQAFDYGDRAIGLQFHLEATEESIRALFQHCGQEITCGPVVQNSSLIDDHAPRLTDSHILMDKLLERVTERQ